MRISKVLFLIIFCFSFSNAQFWKVENTFEKNIIIVNATADKEILADKANFSFSVIGFAKDLNTAVSNAREKVDVIAKDLFKIGLQKKNLTTSQFKSNENKDDKAFLSSKRDFKAIIKVALEIDSLDILEPIVTAVSSRNPDFISDISFSLKNVEKIKIETLELAVAKAKQKANSMVSSFDIKVGNPIYIEELGNDQNMRGLSANVVSRLPGVVNEAKIVEVESFFIETITVSSSVKVIFSIIE